jgi:pimeloyl-ACP methyl ester carboxylesterase
MAYHTSFSQDETWKCDPKKHILILHGTALNKDIYHWTKTSLRMAGYDDVASILSPQLESQSIVDRLHAEAGVCVTTLDLRGHGNSTVTRGPWTIGLLAADVAEALRQIHGNSVQVHAHGHSIGFGIVLKLAMDHPELVWTVSGGGFLADMTVNNLWAAYIFSRDLVVTLLGMQRVSQAAEYVLHCAPPGMTQQLFRYVSRHGYLRASQSWLYFNEQHRLATFPVPVLWQNPIRDELAGVTLAKVQQEFDQLPISKGNRLIIYNESGTEDHCHSLLDPDRMFGDVLDFVRANS